MKEHYAYFLVVAFLCLSSTLFAQEESYNNEWINYEQSYFKIPIAEEGLFRIDYNTLANSNFINNGEGYQLWRNGEQVPIYTSTEGAFSNTDFIEFYAYPNDGEMDTPLFEENGQLSEYYSLFTDTATYFLSWNNDVSNERITDTQNDIGNPPPKEASFWYTELQYHNNSYNRGVPTKAIINWVYDEWEDYELDNTEEEEFPSIDIPNFPYELYPNILEHTTGIYGLNEGFASSILNQNYGVSKKLELDGLYEEDNLSISIEALLVGRSQVLDTNPDHHVEITIDGNLYTEWIAEAYNKGVINFEMDNPDAANVLAEYGNLPIQYNSTANLICDDCNDDNVIVYTQATYPRSFDFNNVDQLLFELEADAFNPKYLEITNFPNDNQSAILYNFNTQERLHTIWENELQKFMIPSANEAQKLFLAKNAKPIPQLNPLTFTNFVLPEYQGDYLIIYHDSTAEVANAYKTYRESTNGGKHEVATINIDQLVDQFAFGISKHPHAIQNIINYAIDNWEYDLENVLLLGSGVTYHQSRFNPTVSKKDLIPTYGNLASDFLFTMRDRGSQAPQTSIGRLPILNNEDGLNYLNKVIDFESLAYECNEDEVAWKNNVLNRVHTYSINSMYNPFLDQLNENLSDTYTQESLNLNTYNFNTSGSNEWAAIAEEETAILQEGVGIINFLGESGMYNVNIVPDFLEEDPTYYNFTDGRYPFLFLNADFVASIFPNQSANNLLTRYLLAENAGTIASIGSVSFEFYNAEIELTSRYYELMADSLNGASAGTLLKTVIGEYFDSPNIDEQLKTLEYLYLGDPALVITPCEESEIPDCYIPFNSPLQEEFPWMAEIINNECDCCQYNKVTEYNNGLYSFLYVEPSEEEDCDASPLLYYNNQLYCSSSPTYNCFNAYGLNNWQAKILWSCGEYEEPDPCDCYTLYEPVCGSDGIEYNNDCYAECAGVSWTNGPCIDPTNPPSTPDTDYEWLNTQLSDSDCCEANEVYRYTKGNFSFIYIVPSDETDCNANPVMYNEQGLLYCNSQAGYDCISLYELNIDSDIELIYSCEEGNPNNGGENNNENISDSYNWLNSLLDPNDCCKNGSVYEYFNGPYAYLFIDNCEGYGTLYNASGQLYCSSAANYDCLQLYGLNNQTPNLIWDCSGKDSGLISVNNSIDAIVYPNPTNGIVNIETNFDTAAQANIYNLQGKLIQTEYFSKVDEIDLSNNNSGIYLIRISDGQQTIVKKLIIN